VDRLVSLLEGRGPGLTVDALAATTGPPAEHHSETAIAKLVRQS
jgi:hypothetical protein